MNKAPLAKSARVSRSQQFLLLNNPLPLKPQALPKFTSAQDVVERMKPSEPVTCLRPHVIKTAAKWFVSSFPGQVMYAVKTNPEPLVLKTIFKAGVRHFDVASLAEVELTARECPKATMHYMHPVKSRESILHAYHKYGVRSFSLDSFDELLKIQEMTHHARDLTLYIRLAMPNEHAAYSLQGKFGVQGAEAIELLRAARSKAAKLGVCFHVGSQCMDPADYRTAIGKVRALIDEAGVAVDMIDVGGGFPSIYPNMAPPALQGYMDTIRAALGEHGFSGMDVFCEPGRALVAESGSVVVKVELRKGNALYINDGVYGSLFDAGYPGFVYPARAMRPHETFTGETEAFSLFGPTCDSLDAMKGPFMLPADIREGDWIEIGGLGAYGSTMRTRFNGFYSDKQAELSDNPMLSLFGLH
jgi:ornithine decarboxylase